MNWFSFLGSTGFLFPAYLILIAYCIFDSLPQKAMFIGCSGAGIFLITNLVKVGFLRARPANAIIMLPGTFSFPSGHSASALTFYSLLAWLVTGRIERVWLKCVLVLLIAVLLLAIGGSRIYLGVHYPTDILAGYTLAVALTSLLR